MILCVFICFLIFLILLIVLIVVLDKCHTCCEVGDSLKCVQNEEVPHLNFFASVDSIDDVIDSVDDDCSGAY